MLDTDGQPLIRGFCYARNRDKAAHALRGILHGVIADKKLNDQELLFLSIWLRKQKDLGADRDAEDLSGVIEYILSDGLISALELAQLKQLINEILNDAHRGALYEEDCINELHGILLGIAADGKLEDEELAFLDRWFSTHEQLVGEWPAEVLIERMEKIRADGVIDAQERREILELIKNLTGNRFDENGDADVSSSHIFATPISEFDHCGKKVCFTAKFLRGSRRDCEKLAKDRGAIIRANVSGGLDALIVGSMTSRDWRFQSHGRKIERALALNKAGKSISILPEQRWLSFL